MATRHSKSTISQHNLPIGIFDSGIGGLSIANQIKQRLPNEHLIYLADNLHAPYGEKSDAFICQRVLEIGEFLTKQPVKAIVVACNTATVTAIQALRAKYSIPIIGVEPAIKPAALHSKNRKVGVLVTQATASTQRFHDLIHTYATGADVFIQPCPGLVELIEKLGDNTQQISTLLDQYLTGFIEQDIDTLVLGCTHYPLVKALIASKLNSAVNIIDTGIPVSAQLERKLIEFDLLASAQPTQPDVFYTSACNQTLAKKIAELWQYPAQVLPVPLN
ncbi:glutamate racemase [Thalassotalea sp. LPB0316]|uniref:glutamate racemase n=1 Tax=Thalassotalea sp. LPB0316 TaxID=2769490 RepID=UPI0018695A3B|nr:glutamate racemase [Thalassotalea sp. LPB0316]QOL25679.1 glutamate racemase [Thalassotalea sp. LPB0316]